jgi:serine/threonine-protein kinase
MPPDDDVLSERERRLDEVVTAYLQALGSADVPDREALCADHPDLAEELAEFIGFQDWLYRLSTPLRCVARAAEEATPLPGETLSADESIGPASAEAGREFGGYELLGRVGAGGMGVVYRARQKSPNRLVALKVIRMRELTLADDARRFRAEAETAAALDHPHVVPVYEVSEHEGQLFYSMRLMEGGSLASQLGRLRDDPRSAARLVAIVARVVHHAHQRGILHRDLKPANILLDREGQPHVSDFGLAKRMDADGSLTQTGAIVGTPQYMAPEQTSGQKGVMTTATDVYGLGTVLYVLLTGRPPFQGETVLETLERVREREPVPPRQINAKVDRDLETICLKCLQKEPHRRYESAQALAEDMERWLKGEVIWARRNSTWERLRRWIRRRPAVAALLAVVVVAGIALVGGLIWHDEKMQRASEREKAEADRARQGRQLARQAVDRMYTQVATQWLEDEPHLSDLQRSFLEEALHFYQELSQEESDESVLRQETARAYRHVGDILTKLDRRTEAEQAYSQAIAIFSELLTERPDEPSSAYELARTYRGIGSLMHRAGRPPEAEKFWRRGLKIAEDLVQNHPDEAEYQLNFGTFCQNLGYPGFEPPEPERLLERGKEALEKLLADSPNNAKYHQTLGSIVSNLAIWRMIQNKPGEARRLLEQAIEHTQAALKINPRLKNALLSVRNHYALLGGDVLPALGLHEEALKAAQEGLTVAKRLTAESPAVFFYAGHEAESQSDVGRVLKNLGRLEEAELALRQARTLWEKIITQSTDDVPDGRRILCETCTCLGEVLAAKARDREAIAEYRRALELDRTSTSHKVNLSWALAWLGCATPQEVAEAVALARQATKEQPLTWQTWNALGGALYQAEEWNESVQALEKALQLTKGGSSAPAHLFWAMAQWHLGNKEEARDRYRQVSRLMEKSANWNAEWKRIHAEATTLLGVNEQGTKDKEVSPKKK